MAARRDRRDVPARRSATLAALLGCEPTEEAVFAHRRATDPDAYAATLLRATGTEWLLIDDGFPAPGEGADWERMGELAGCRSAPVMRIERVAEEGDRARARRSPSCASTSRAEVAAARGRGFAGLKTIAAYRSGLDVAAAGPDAAPPRAPRGRARAPRATSALLELLLARRARGQRRARRPAARSRCTAASATPTCSCPRADPALLGPLVERFRDTPFVLLHCYPFVRQAGWLAHVYGNVFFDVSLTIPHVWRAAEMVREALELAPVSKLLYASDAARTPELYYLAAKAGATRWPRCSARRSARRGRAGRAGDAARERARALRAGLSGRLDRAGRAAAVEGQREQADVVVGRVLDQRAGDLGDQPRRRGARAARERRRQAREAGVDRAGAPLDEAVGVEQRGGRPARRVTRPRRATTASARAGRRAAASAPPTGARAARPPARAAAACAPHTRSASAPVAGSSSA